jgi:hypothetical protein
MIKKLMALRPHPVKCLLKTDFVSHPNTENRLSEFYNKRNDDGVRPNGQQEVTNLHHSFSIPHYYLSTNIYHLK